MDRPNRIAEIYGYLVCLVAVVTVLITTNAVVDNIFVLANPLASEREWGGASLVSYEAFEATYEPREPAPPVRDGAAPQPAERPSGAELRRRYEVLRADRLAHARFRATRSLTTSGIVLAVALALFATHWRWLRGLRREDRAAATAGAPAA
jgi:hypothetical protein